MGVLAVPVIGSLASSAEAGPVQDRQRPGKTGLALRGQFESIRAHENVHVTFLVTELGSAARPKPQFKNLLQRDFRSFAAVSQALENTGVGAYLNALPNITSRAYVSAAGSIALVEARHAGFLNNFQGVKLTASPAMRVGIRPSTPRSRRLRSVPLPADSSPASTAAHPSITPRAMTSPS